MKKEVVSVAKSITIKENQIEAILLEYSVLPAYAWAVSQETKLPVFDYITMVNYVFSALVKKTYSGFM